MSGVALEQRSCGSLGVRESFDSSENGASSTVGTLPDVDHHAVVGGRDPQRRRLVPDYGRRFALLSPVFRAASRRDGCAAVHLGRASAGRASCSFRPRVGRVVLDRDGSARIRRAVEGSPLSPGRPATPRRWARTHLVGQPEIVVYPGVDDVRAGPQRGDQPLDRDEFSGRMWVRNSSTVTSV